MPSSCSIGSSGCEIYLGLLAEEYDPRRYRLIGNFPQAFSHLALIFGARHGFKPVTTAASRCAVDREAVVAAWGELLGH